MTPTDFLKLDSSISDNDKVLHYDELRAQYSNTLAKLQNFEKKCNNLERQISLYEPSRKSQSFLKQKEVKIKLEIEKEENNCDNKNIDNEINDKTGDKKFGGLSKWSQDPSLPVGWQSAQYEGDNFGRRYKDPAGKFFGSRLEVLRSMWKQPAAYPAGTVEQMRAGLFLDGWRTSESLPADWMMKRSGGHTEYLTRNLVLLAKMSAVVRHLREHGYTEQEVDRFKEGNGLQWQTDPDLPRGWRYGRYFQSKNGWLKNYMDPAGKSYGSVGQILRHFQQIGATAELEQTKRYLLKEGWFTTDLLPDGSYMKQKKSEKGFYYLTPEFERLHTTKRMVSYLRHEAGWPTSKVDRFLFNYKTLATTEVEPRNTKYRNMKSVYTPVKVQSEEQSEEPEEEATAEEENDLTDDEDDDATAVGYGEDDCEEEGTGLEWENDLFLPAGWKVAQTRVVGGRQSGTLIRRYRSPRGDHLASLVEVLRLLQSEAGEVGPELREGLRYDGWTGDTQLPPGWLVKLTNTGQKMFLSPSLDTCTGLQELAAHLRATNQPAAARLAECTMESSAVEVEPGRAEEKDWLPEPGLPPGWKAAVYEPTLSGSLPFRKYMRPDGKIMNSRVVAIRHMLDERTEFSQEDTQAMIAGLALDGWMDITTVPEQPGWRKRKTSCYFSFLSPTFEYFKYPQKVFEYLKSKDVQPHVIEKFRLESSFSRLAKRKPSEEDDACSPNPKLAKSQEESLSLRISNVVSLKEAVSEPNIKKERMENGAGSGAGSVRVKQEAESCWLPPGWREETEAGAGLVGPAGRRVNSRLELLQLLLTSNKCSAGEVERLWQSLAGEGWASDNEKIPPGWRLKWEQDIQDYRYLTPARKLLRSTSEAFAHVRDSGQFDFSAIIRFEVWAGEAGAKSAALQWREDPSLPPGWTVASSAGSEILRNVAGARFGSRKEGIDWLIGENSPPQQIFQLWTTLDREGWLTNPSLPTGWKVKDSNFFLSPNLEVVRGDKELLSVVTGAGEYSQEEIGRLQTWLDSRNTVTCPDCKVELTGGPPSLLRHSRVCSKSQQDRHAVCKFCSSSFHNYSNMERHVREVCRAISREDRAAILKTEMGESFQCPKCHRGYRREGNLARHACMLVAKPNISQ